MKLVFQLYHWYIKGKDKRQKYIIRELLNRIQYFVEKNYIESHIQESGRKKDSIHCSGCGNAQIDISFHSSILQFQEP